MLYLRSSSKARPGLRALAAYARLRLICLEKRYSMQGPMTKLMRLTH
ncbi:MAG: hypothetical protein JWM21_860 [Acidobacteria bacterium]|nr:hypothetical protein [Acidobacteriota bacterium]